MIPTSILGGVMTVAAQNGVATFSGLSISQAGFDALGVSGVAIAGTSVLVAIL